MLALTPIFFADLMTLWVSVRWVAAVLVAVGVMAGQVRGIVARRDPDGAWLRRVGLLSASTLALIGVYLMAS